jgi:hypothetical protein
MWNVSKAATSNGRLRTDAEGRERTTFPVRAAARDLGAGESVLAASSRSLALLTEQSTQFAPLQAFSATSAYRAAARLLPEDADAMPDKTTKDADLQPK